MFDTSVRWSGLALAAGALILGVWGAAVVARAAGAPVHNRPALPLAAAAAGVAGFVLQSLGVKPGWCWYIIAAAAVAAGVLVPRLWGI